VVLWLCLSPALFLAGANPPALPDSVLPCTPCHHRGTRDQVAEWLVSPYSEVKGGRGCTDCHDRYCSGSDLRGTGTGGRAKAGSLDSSVAVRLTMAASCADDEILVEVAVSNLGVGHLVPTGASERSMVLEVFTRDRISVIAVPRLRPFATSVSRHRFELTSHGSVHVSAQLVLVQSPTTRLEFARAETVCPSDDGGP
jgi:hypothetical protein